MVYGFDLGQPISALRVELDLGFWTRLALHGLCRSAVAPETPRYLNSTAPEDIQISQGVPPADLVEELPWS
jgi:hypothetical protein